MINVMIFLFGVWFNPFNIQRISEDVGYINCKDGYNDCDEVKFCTIHLDDSGYHHIREQMTCKKMAKMVNKSVNKK